MEKGKDAWEGKQEVATEAAKKHGRKTRPRNSGRKEFWSRKWGTHTAQPLNRGAALRGQSWEPRAG